MLEIYNIWLHKGFRAMLILCGQELKATDKRKYTVKENLIRVSTWQVGEGEVQVAVEEGPDKHLVMNKENEIIQHTKRDRGEVMNSKQSRNIDLIVQGDWDVKEELTPAETKEQQSGYCVTYSRTQPCYQWRQPSWYAVRAHNIELWLIRQDISHITCSHDLQSKP